MPHAMMAPKGPVAMPKVLGREKIPEPTMDPTTMAVSVNSGSFCTPVALAVGEDEVATLAIVPASDGGETASSPSGEDERAGPGGPPVRLTDPVETHGVHPAQVP